MFSLAFRTRKYGIEYEYEYDKSQNSATSKANGDEGASAHQNHVPARRPTLPLMSRRYGRNIAA
jgi:hypothetical protein